MCSAACSYLYRNERADICADGCTVANFKAKALNRGDVSAALRLEMFYSMTVGDRAESLRWMKLAARLGDDGAIAYLKAEGINPSN